jgi:DNA-binding PadR family transcriptional regulator
MALQHTILGLLSNKPMTGYDIKKIIQDSPFMYWSGNNNQVYKSLLELRDEGYVTSEVHHQDDSPSKKVYTITDDGRSELRAWVRAAPELPEIKNSFLVRLAWTAPLDNDELLSMITAYAHEIDGAIFVVKEKSKGFAPGRTPREIAIWELIYSNVVELYANELGWIERIRETIGQFNADEYRLHSTAVERKRENEMTYQVIEKNDEKYILVGGGIEQIDSEQDGLAMITACVENGTNRLLLQGELLSDDFLRLQTGLAGAILQKFVTYNIKAVVVLPNKKIKGKFKNLITESNKRNNFRVAENLDEAEKWLIENEEQA